MPNDLAQYFRALTNERSVRAIAMRAHLDQSTVNRQLTGSSTLSVETVVSICRAYGLDFADVFVEVGFITEAEAQKFGQRFRLADVADAELAKEIVRRLGNGEATAAITEPVPADVVEQIAAERDTDPEANVSYLGHVRPEDLPQKRAADTRPRVGEDDGAE